MPQEFENLIDDGFNAVRNLEFDRALEIADQILEQRHTSGFEIKADALWGLGRHDEAIAVLEQGVQAAPEVWRLWQSLGIFYSDLDRFDQSNAAFEQALKNAQTPQNSVLFNYAIAMGRQDNATKGLELLDQIQPGDEELSDFWVNVLRASLLNSLERYQEALDLCNQLIANLDENEMEEWVSRVYSERANARWALTNDPQASLPDAWEAIRWNKASPFASWLIRAVENQWSPDARYFKLLVRGRWMVPPDEGAVKSNGKPAGKLEERGFFALYWIVADNPEEALEYARRFESPDWADTLEIEGFEEQPLEENVPKGVYHADLGYVSFPLTESE